MDLQTWLTQNNSSIQSEAIPPAKIEPNTWREIRLFLSSTFVDTQAERDALIKRVIPNVNRTLAKRFIRIVPVDLRWGVLSSESNSCEAIQMTCLNQLDKCRQETGLSPWFLGLRTERYGWVQDKLNPAEGFEHPEQYEWLDKFNDYGKHVSITSLECIHASVPPKQTTDVPTVLFYKRHVTNPENVEQNMRWVFDYEYVLPETELAEDVKYQYARSSDANDFEEDRKKLDGFLKTSPHCKYTDYDCFYEEKGAYYTLKNEGRKSFGVGYVKGLAQFEKQVEKDLLEAIEGNFEELEIVDVPAYVAESIQHENAIKTKASNFVGRQELIASIFEHCSAMSEGGSNAMFIHGEPGCGKSGLLAATAQKCLLELRETNGNFVFIQAVDSCPGSNQLAKMLRRLQLSLRKYRKDLGEDDLPQECPASPHELKKDHSKFLMESAMKHPTKMFILIVDAVNQFDKSVQAWDMWWLLPEDSPNNLRIVITTLTKENGTYENACAVRPDGVRVVVEDMTMEERQDMVSMNLAKFNKKLTTTDHPYLGNQMKSLISKSGSPLYLVAAAEALRTYGIFENVKDYIVNLPATTSQLFNFLLDRWAAEHGKEFIQDVTGFLCISRDGLLENEINDVISFRETKESRVYDSSFSRLYDSICGFLAAGGGGFLRFFHDLLKFEVEKKFLDAEFKLELHRCLVEFFLSCICPQLIESPTEAPPAYYTHCLQHVVYHQLQSLAANEAVGDFKDTLRNIYFLRERINNDQLSSLQQEYLNAIERSTNDEEITALKQWFSFSQFYSPYIKEYPECVYNMAINQAPNSAVSMDTKGFPEPNVGEGYPLYRHNNPPLVEETRAPMKFNSDLCYSVATSTPERNMCCVGLRGKVLVLKQDSGLPIYEVAVRGLAVSVYISPNGDLFYVGNDDGEIVAYSLDKGVKQWGDAVSSEEFESVIWIEAVASYIACGTGDQMFGEPVIGNITLIDEGENRPVAGWSTGKECYAYCYHAPASIIFSAHQRFIGGWSLDGDLVKIIGVTSYDDQEVNGLSAHMTDDLIVYSTHEYVVGELNFTTWDKSKFETQKNTFLVNDIGFSEPMYDHKCERILCTTKDSQTVLVYDRSSGKLVNKLQGHSKGITNMRLVPNTNSLLTCAGDGAMLWQIPTSPDADIDEKDEDKIVWCQFFPNTSHPMIATLNEGGILCTKDPNTLATLTSTDIGKTWRWGKTKRKVAISPDGENVFVLDGEKVWCVETKTAEVFLAYDYYQFVDESFVSVNDFKISSDGTKLVIVMQLMGAIALDIGGLHDDNKINLAGKLKMRGTHYSCDIHSDNVHAVCGGEAGVHIWNMTNGQTVRVLEDKSSSIVMFYGDQVIFTSGSYSKLHIMHMNGEAEAVNLEISMHYFAPVASLIRNKTQLVTVDPVGCISIYDLASRKQLYSFVDHRSTGFLWLAVSPTNDMIIGYNANGQVYCLKNTMHE